VVTDLASGVEGWFDSPGDVLAILSVIAVLVGAVIWIIDSRLSAIRVSVEDLRDVYKEQHQVLVDRLDSHMASPVHDRRSPYNSTTPYARRKEDQED